jgi:hypothetical protein
MTGNFTGVGNRTTLRSHVVSHWQVISRSYIEYTLLKPVKNSQLLVHWLCTLITSIDLVESGVEYLLH